MIHSYHDVSRGQTIGPVDVCIIGSGAGGSVMAHYLSKAGLKVVLLEKGGYFPSIDHLVPPDITLENYPYFINTMREVAGLEKLSFQ